MFDLSAGLEVRGMLSCYSFSLLGLLNVAGSNNDILSRHYLIHTRL